MREYAGPTKQVWQVAFVPGDPPRLAAIDGERGYLWAPDRPDPAPLVWDEPPPWGEPILAASPDGRWLVAGPSHLPCRWDVTTDPPTGPLTLFVPAARARFTGAPDQLTIIHVVDGGGDPLELRSGVLSVAHPDSGRWGRSGILPLPGDLAARIGRMSPSDWRLQSALSADGSRLAVAPREGPGAPLAREAFLWDVGTGMPPRRVEVSGHPCGLAFSPDGSRLAIDVGTVYVHDTATLEVVACWKAKYDYAPGLAWSPDGKHLARTDNSTTVRVYEAATGREVMAVGGKRGRLVCAAFSPDGLTLATGTHLGPVRVWDVE